MKKYTTAFSAIFLAAYMMLFATAAYATNYALLIAIKDYPEIGVADKSDLPGTLTDLESFRKLAKKMGVKEGNIFTLKDREATSSNIINALIDLTSIATEKDNILVAYSGHGSQWFDEKSKKADQCVEGIVAHKDGKSSYIPDTLLNELFDGLSEKAGKVLVFFDSCFSGGALTTRALENSSTDEFQLRPKFQRDDKDSRSSQCGQAVNRSVSFARGITQGKKNMVFLAAASRNEVASDAGERFGGVATYNWMACLDDPKADTDRSGSISGSELVACAQNKLRDFSIKNFGRSDASQHLQLEGTKEVTVTFADAPPANTAPATANTSSNTQQAGSAIASLTDMYNSRNAKWDVQLKSSKSTYKIKKDTVDLTLSSARKGFAYLLMVGTGADSNGITLLFPNERDTENQIKAGEKLSLPRQAKWRLTPGGPAGTDHLLAVVTTNPIDFTKAGMSKAAIFKQSGGLSTDLAVMQRAISRSLVVDAPEDADSSYGAAFLKITEQD